MPGWIILNWPYIQSDLASHTDAQLTLIFGHHPFEAHYYTRPTRA